MIENRAKIGAVNSLLDWQSPREYQNTLFALQGALLQLDNEQQPLTVPKSDLLCSLDALYQFFNHLTPQSHE